MRRVAEFVDRARPGEVFLMNLPSTWQTATAHKLYASELWRLGRFLVALGGTELSHERLSAIIRDYGARRSLLRAARGRLSPRQYAEAIADFHREGEVRDYVGGPMPATQGVAVALVGGPLLPEHLEIFDIVERAGGYVALNATSTGDRALPAPFDLRMVADSPLAALADAYFGAIPDAFRRPNSELYRWLKEEVVETGVRGMIFWRYLWCDIWHAEAQRMKEWADLPFLTLDIGDEGISNRIVSRVQSLLEILG
jgi:benzoyl-CoA reductase/2-hydroxyglutaryl-CoA dehydratase subunit BcrC/BadD/HgdB